MKEISRFVVWMWTGLENWQKMFVVAIVLQAVALFMDKSWGVAVSGAGMAILAIYLFKWIIWDPLKSNWGRYKEHRNSLLTTIKNSDK